MKISHSITSFSIHNPKKIASFMAVVTFVFLILVLLPSVLPQKFSFLHPIQVDTDPENMLPEDEPVRVFHNQMKKEFSLNEIMVVGIVNDTHENGVFNRESLSKIYELASYSKTLSFNDEKNPGKKRGVISVDLIAPSTVDNIEQGGPGVVKFEWLMLKPPETDEDALLIKDKAKKIPFLNGTLISENGKAICLYLPLTSKDVSFQVYSKLNEKIASFNGDEKFYITGLPVANDTFGVEMFKQMAMSAPLAMLAIFLLMLYFFRKLVLIVSPLILAVVSVICTMGFLVVTGNTIHIMSSMIPIFIMPIAVLDSVHILSEFFDLYPRIKNRKETIYAVMDDLFMPMLYTSLTSMAGFVSLALTPIPPVQVFGLFVGIGVMLAWLFTVTFIPAYVMLIPESSLKNFGHSHHEGDEKKGLSKFLFKVGEITFSKAKLIIILTFLLGIIAFYGMSKIQVNDNPVKWFAKTHPIRIADKELNKHFGGTYMAYLYFEGKNDITSLDEYKASFFEKLQSQLKSKDSDEVRERVLKLISDEILKNDKFNNIDAFLSGLEKFISVKMDDASDEEYYALDDIFVFLQNEKNRNEIFKNPDILRYIEKLQNYLLTTGVVGKSNSLSDIVKTVYRELMEGDKEYFKIPDSKNAVAQCLLTYQNSHRPQDLWHFVTPDYEKTSLWIQLKSGNNKDMNSVVSKVDEFISKNPPPTGLNHKWFGLTYINTVWQKKMVWGMMKAFLGSFFVVFLMMTILFKSSLWGILAMIPLTVTIGLIYGAVGFLGKDYDMPIAVLSSLTLGLAVDFAIHFLARSREVMKKKSTWKDAAGIMFDEPARAITRNIIVIAIGFTPLLAAPLIPYKTVGAFLATILGVAGISTLLIIPALISVFEKKFFPKIAPSDLSCRCTSCIVTGLTLIAVIVVNFQDYLKIGWSGLTVLSLIGVVLSARICVKLSRRKKCAIR